jgi:hypothetical protein
MVDVRTTFHPVIPANITDGTMARLGSKAHPVVHLRAWDRLVQKVQDLCIIQEPGLLILACHPSKGLSKGAIHLIVIMDRQITMVRQDRLQACSLLQV